MTKVDREGRPTVSIAGMTSALTNSAYMLYLNADDAGIDRVTKWIIDWGDKISKVGGDACAGIASRAGVV